MNSTTLRAEKLRAADKAAVRRGREIVTFHKLIIHAGYCPGAIPAVLAHRRAQGTHSRRCAL
jgi:hypothetical protein